MIWKIIIGVYLILVTIMHWECIFKKPYFRHTKECRECNPWGDDGPCEGTPGGN